jgi:LDH2 family malate/lactate/ureidoglycolate dehydrogenase
MSAGNGCGDGTVVDATRLRDWVAAVLGRYGVQGAHASTAADVLVAADLQGIDSHGVARLPAYLRRLQSGATATEGEPQVSRSGEATASVDGRNLMGPAVAELAMSEAIELCRTAGAGMVAVRNSNHFGIAGYYARMAVSEGLIGYTCTNAGPRVAPTGANQPFFGTNPFAVAVPTSGTLPVVVDMATSAVATGKLELATRAGTRIPEGWGVDGGGAATTDPRALAAGGWLLPLGSFPHLSSHKGFALALLVDVFSGILAGGPYAYGVQNLMFTEAGGPSRVGHFMMALDPGRFGDRDVFRDKVAAMVEDLHALPTSDTAAPLMTPGEPEWRCEQRRRVEGIPLHGSVWDSLRAVADDLGLALEAGKPPADDDGRQATS